MRHEMCACNCSVPLYLRDSCLNLTLTQPTLLYSQLNLTYLTSPFLTLFFPHTISPAYFRTTLHLTASTVSTVTNRILWQGGSLDFVHLDSLMNILGLTNRWTQTVPRRFVAAVFISGTRTHTCSYPHSYTQTHMSVCTCMCLNAHAQIWRQVSPFTIFSPSAIPLLCATITVPSYLYCSLHLFTRMSDGGHKYICPTKS